MNEKKYSITFFGDFVSNSPNSIVIDKEIQNIIESSYYNVINFEAPVRRSNQTPSIKSGPSLFQSEQSASFLESIGMNVISVANNHIFDYGREGCFNTLRQFKKAQVIGVGSFLDAYTPLTFSLQGEKIALFAVAHKEFGVIDSPEVEFGYAWACHPYLLQQIQKYKSQGFWVIIYAHCGIEDIPVPIPEWRYKYREFVDFGADAVIASHPHIVQGYEEYKNKRIYYSLGNLFFDRVSSEVHWKKGLIVSLTISDHTFSYKERYTIKQGNNLLVDHHPDKNIEELNRLLSDKYYVETINSVVEHLAPLYLSYYKRGTNGIARINGVKSLGRAIKRILRPKEDPVLLLNMIQCESHRWLFERVLKTQQKNHM